jgi:hypothetical protein
LPLIDEFGPITITHDPSLPTFVRFKDLLYTITPTKKGDIGISQIKVVIANKYLKSQFKFNIKVLNDPPGLSGGVKGVENIEIQKNQQVSINLP